MELPEEIKRELVNWDEVIELAQSFDINLLKKVIEFTREYLDDKPIRLCANELDKRNHFIYFTNIFSFLPSRYYVEIYIYPNMNRVDFNEDILEFNNYDDYYIIPKNKIREYGLA